MPLTIGHLFGRLNAQGIIEPTFYEIELQLAVGDRELISIALRHVGHPRDDRATAAGIELDPRRQRELVEESEVAHGSQRDRRRAVELGRPAKGAWAVAERRALV